MIHSLIRAKRVSAALLLSCVFFVSGLTGTQALAYADTAGTASSSVSSTIATGLGYAKTGAFTAKNLASSFYFAQSASGRCTIASAAMMIRRAAYLDGKTDWQDITEASVSADGWSAAGVKCEFASEGYSVTYTQLDGTSETLQAMLEKHPEGIAVYDPSLPHAVLLTDYDASSDTFYCADPASYYSGSRIPVADSWNGEVHGHDQAAVISGFSSAWIIAS